MIFFSYHSKLRSKTKIDIRGEVFLFDGFEILSKVSWKTAPLVHHLGDKIIYAQVNSDSTIMEVGNYQDIEFLTCSPIEFLSMMLAIMNWKFWNPICFMLS